MHNLIQVLHRDGIAKNCPARLIRVYERWLVLGLGILQESNSLSHVLDKRAITTVRRSTKRSMIFVMVSTQKMERYVCEVLLNYRIYSRIR